MRRTNDQNSSPKVKVGKAIQVTFAIACLVGFIIMIGTAIYDEFVPGQSSTRTFSSDAPQQDSSPPFGHTIKGNISVSSGEKLYHVPGMRDYEITVIDTSRGERWFRTEEEAIANGWRKAGPN